MADPAPFVTALDDTHLRKTGLRIPGVAYRRWRKTGRSPRLSTARLLQQVRRELWCQGLERRHDHSRGFVTQDLSNTKCLKFQSSLPSAVLYVSTG